MPFADDRKLSALLQHPKSARTVEGNYVSARRQKYKAHSTQKYICYFSLMKTKSLVIIISLFSETLAQAQISINCSGKQFYIPSFRKDSTKKDFIEKKFEES